MNLLSVIVSFLKVGVYGFGGGSALIPVIEKEVVENKNMISSEDYNDYIVASNITPGAIQIKLAAACGEFVSGIPGLLAASYAITFPGTFLTILLLSLLSILSSDFLFQVEKASVGISAFIIFLLIMYIVKVMKDAHKQNFLTQAWIIMAVATVLTFGKEIRKIITLLLGNPLLGDTPLLDISIINLLFISFFIIFFLGGRWESKRGITAILVTLLYLCTIGKTVILPFAWAKTALLIIMVALAVIGVYKDISKEIKDSGQNRIKISFKRPFIQVLWFIIFIVLAVIPLLFLTDSSETIWYTVNGFISTITSFGGGEAYLSVADGIFVAGEFIPAQTFYSQILPIANALPGPILVKILSGVGYVFGVAASGQLVGWLAALLGMALGVGGSCIVFVLVFAIYNSFSSLKIFKVLKQWILPVICGLLISTILSMLGEMLSVTAQAGLHQIEALPAIIGIIFMCWFLHKKFKISDVILIILSGIVSLIIL